jgi:hypothetical protein
MQIIDEIEVCQDCLIWLANADDSGIREEDRERVKSSVAALGPHAVATGTECGFSSYRCECCNGLAGERFKVTILGHTCKDCGFWNGSDKCELGDTGSDAYTPACSQFKHHS